MKLKKLLILAYCVIVATMGITLTGCDLNIKDILDGFSNDTSAESTNTDYESSSDTNDENRYLGTWAATVMESAEGDVYDYEEKLGGYEITLNADYTTTGKANDNTFDGGTWELTENGVKIADPNGVSAEYIYKDGELIWDLEMGDVKATIHFVKKQ